ncbi:hypothetical protein Tco_0679846 [Tanacetum coccineum]|uniref:Uncharacterized protein n=1 Tax=Tanacetum coccineum TaxID=301880 RepID=A0ABQ4XJ35_9ASTR
MTHPPLEFTWFYSALAFHTAKPDSPNLVLTIKDLFNSLLSFRSDNGYLNQVSLVAPVIYQLVTFKDQIVRFRSDVVSLADGLVSYIVMCCENENVNDVGGVEVGGGGGWVSVVPVWIADRVNERCGRVDGLELFFPFTSGEIRKGVVDGECGMECLAGVVMVEAFLFRLCLVFGEGRAEVEVCKDVKSCAVQIIKGFKKNPAFLVMLFKLLLEPSLPVTELLTTTDELLLRRLLFDVALDLGLCLSFDTSPRLSDVKYKEIVILWLFVSSSALQFASDSNDHARVNYYLNAFSSSQLPREIIVWVTGLTSITPTAPDISSPKDIIGWLLVLEKQGLKLCDHSISELHEKFFKYKSMGFDSGVKNAEAMVEDAPARMNRIRKRESAGFGEVEKQIKAIKCCHGNLGDDGFYGKNEVANSVPDQEMVDMVR